MYEWTEIKRLDSENAYENYRAGAMCCSVSYWTCRHDQCSVCAVDHTMVERRVRCSSGACKAVCLCPVVWKVFQCTVYDQWGVKINGQDHGRSTPPCDGCHKPVVTQAIKAFIAEDDEGDGATPRLIETRMKKKLSTMAPERGWPSLDQVANALKRIREASGTRKTIEAIEKFVASRTLTADTHRSPEKAFLFGPTLNGDGRPHVGSGTDDDPFIIAATSWQKLETAIKYAQPGNFTMFHADATFKLSDYAYPVITCGFTDSARTYQLVALFVVSQRTTRDFKLCFQSLATLCMQLFGARLDVNAFMGDADDAQVAGFQSVPDFAHVTPLMCFFHVLYNVRKKTSHLSPSLRMMVMTSIMDMHYCLSMEEFEHVRNEELARWGTAPELEAFRDYFVRQWLSGRFWRWQIFHTPPGYAATNNPCEVYNSSVKSYVRRRRHHMTKLLDNLCDLIESHRSFPPTADKCMPKASPDVVKAAIKMVTSGRTTIQRVVGGSCVRIHYRPVSREEDTTTSDAAFTAAFDVRCDVGKKVTPRKDAGFKIAAEKTKAAAMHKRACSWSLWRAHAIGTPHDGWLVDFVRKICGCRYYQKFKVCVHVLIAEYRDHLSSLGKSRKIVDRSRAQSNGNQPLTTDQLNEFRRHFPPWH